MMRRVAIVAVTVLALVVAALPVVLTLLLGWYRTDVLGSTFGEGSDIYVILILLYAVWLPGTMFGMVYLYDRLGYQYQVHDRGVRASRREDRRQRAGGATVSPRGAAGAAAGGRPAPDDEHEKE
jgi:fatty acid desaturase